MKRLRDAMNFGAVMSSYMIVLSAAQGVELNSGALYGGLTLFKYSKIQWICTGQAAKRPKLSTGAENPKATGQSA